MVTVTCGLALQGPAAADASFRQAGELSALIGMVAGRASTGVAPA
jgi:hypothetical protein